MLDRIEAQFLSPLSAALPGVQVIGGPPELASGSGPLVAVHARRLEVLDPPDSETAGPSRAHALQVVRWTADGSTSAPPPADPPFADPLLEVEAPPGFPLVRGEAFEVAAGRLTFLRPPSAGTEVVATLQGERRRGFVSRGPCRLELALSSWAATPAQVDAHLWQAVASVLQAAIALPVFDAELDGLTGMRARLRQLRLSLGEVVRAASEPGGVLRASAVLAGRASLEVYAVTAEAPLESVIAEVQVDRADSTS